MIVSDGKPWMKWAIYSQLGSVRQVTFYGGENRAGRNLAPVHRRRQQTGLVSVRTLAAPPVLFGGRLRIFLS